MENIDKYEEHSEDVYEENCENNCEEDCEKTDEYFADNARKKMEDKEKKMKGSKPMAQIIIPSTEFPSNVRARVEAMRDPEFQKRKRAWMDEKDPELKEKKEQEMWERLDELMKVLDAEDEEMRTVGPRSLNQKLYSDVTQAVAARMVEIGIIKKPELTYIANDPGILERLFKQSVAQPDIVALKQRPDDMYLIITGMHAVGAGMYVTLVTHDFGHVFAEELTPAEVDKIFSAFGETDAYELGLTRCKIPLDSNNKKIIDNIIITGMNAAKESAGDQIFEPKNIKTYLHVLYNVGNTIIMRS